MFEDVLNTFSLSGHDVTSEARQTARLRRITNSPGPLNRSAGPRRVTSPKVGIFHNLQYAPTLGPRTDAVNPEQRSPMANTAPLGALTTTISRLVYPL